MDRRKFVSRSAVGMALASAAASTLADPDTIAKPLKLRYAISLDTHFKNKSPLDRLKAIADQGFTAVEFNGLPRLEQAAGAAEPNYDAIGVYGKTLKALKLSQGVWVTNPCAGKCPCSLVDPAGHAEFLRRVEHSVRIAPLVEGTVSTVTSGVESPDLSPEQMTQNTVEALKRAAEIVEKAGGPILVLEPLNVLVDHPGYHVVKTEHAAEIIDKVGSDKVKILYDIYHQQISEGNLSGNIRKHFDRIGYFQFGDHPGRHEPFTGEIHYPKVFELIHSLGYRGIVGGEFSPAGGGGEAPSLASLAAIRRADQCEDHRAQIPD